MQRSVLNPHGLSPEAEHRRATWLRSNTDEEPMPAGDDLGAVAAWRTRQHLAWGEGTVAGEVEHRREVIAGVPCLVAGDDDLPTVMHLHAGGFCLGSPGTDAPITARLARHVRVVSVQYRLAPEHPFPAAIEDASAVYEVLSAETSVAICGVSAGGNLAVQVAMTCSALPCRLALLCPHVDFGGGRRALRPYEAAYLADTDPSDPSAAPSEADPAQLGALPPLLVQASSDEPMWASIERFAVDAHQAGADVTLETWRGLWHAWHYHRELPEAHDAVDRAAEWLAGH